MSEIVAASARLPVPRRVNSGKVKAGMIGLIFPACLLIAWICNDALGFLPPHVLPSISTVLDAFKELIVSGDLQSNTLASFRRVAAGFAAGALTGIVLGSVMGFSARARRIIDPLFVPIAQIPPIGLIPLLIPFLGIGETMKIVVIAKAALVPVAINTSEGIRNVPVAWREVGSALTFSRLMELRYIVGPAALPTIFSGIRYGLTSAWHTLVGVEILASSVGIGFLMVWGRQLFRMDLVIVAMIIVGLIGFLLDAILARIEQYFQRWKTSK